MNSAFYLYRPTDVVPESVHVATARNSARIRNGRVRQYLMESAPMAVGMGSMGGKGAAVRLPTKERMMAGLPRSAGSMPPDYYKELMGSHRRLANKLDVCEVEDCIAPCKRAGGLFGMFQRKVP